MRKYQNKPKVSSVQLEKTLNFSITFSVPPSTRERVNYCNGGGKGRNNLAFAKPSYKILASCYTENLSKNTAICLAPCAFQQCACASPLCLWGRPHCRLPSKVFFHQRVSSIKGFLPLKVVFHQRLSSIKCCLPSKVIFHWRSSSI